MTIPRVLGAVAAVLLALGAPVAAGPAWSALGNGDADDDGRPTYRERAILALTNACRQDPQGYRDTYLENHRRILLPKNYPAVRPLYASATLSRAARAHSRDMARTPCFQHDSCDGTSLWTRIRRYYKEGGAMAENIAHGYASPLDAVNGWLLDGGAPDRSKGDGHRKNIMGGKYREVGHGSVPSDARRGVYDTQDFGDGPADFATPLVSGSHVLTDGGRISFLASFHAQDGKAPRDAVVELDGKDLKLRRAFGTPASATWRVEVPRASACRRYVFRFRDGAGRTWRHPEGGVLFTTGEGGCRKEYASNDDDSDDDDEDREGDAGTH